MLVTGSSGLIGSEVVRHFCGPRLDGARRRQQPAGRFLRPARATRAGTSARLERECPALHASRARHPRPRRRCSGSSTEIRPDLIVHAAAQPSHDLAASRPFDDFDVNAVGTLNLLEADAPLGAGRRLRPHEHQQGLRRPAQHDSARRSCATRWDYADPADCERHPRRRSASTRASTACSAPARWRPT